MGSALHHPFWVRRRPENGRTIDRCLRARQGFQNQYGHQCLRFLFLDRPPGFRPSPSWNGGVSCRASEVWGVQQPAFAHLCAGSGAASVARSNGGGHPGGAAPTQHPNELHQPQHAHPQEPAGVVWGARRLENGAIASRRERRNRRHVRFLRSRRRSGPKLNPDRRRSGLQREPLVWFLQYFQWRRHPKRAVDQRRFSSGVRWTVVVRA